MAFLLQITETRMPDALLEAGGSSVLQTAASASPTITVHGSALQTHQVPTREHTTEYPQPLIQTLWGHMCFRIHHFLDVCTFMDQQAYTIYYVEPKWNLDLKLLFLQQKLWMFTYVGVHIDYKKP